MITLDNLYELFPRTAKKKLQDFHRVFTEIAVPELELNSPQRVAAFIAQVGHESDSFRTMTEYASGRDYENRRDLGNNMPGDGPRYKGRGYIQLTGRANYQKFTAWYRLREPDAPDFLQQPDLIGQIPELAMWATVYFWNSRKLNQFSDKGLFQTLTRRINGGLNGYAHRLQIFESVWKILQTNQ